ncbi:hypothetical protein [Paraburkholderia heleia]|uniref:hypothetical protein n=1 Tax=Paraburkholderia heleia TaxID=634127 RepID=UPI002AB7E9ED|nr:hypothetical protein [Paraburkholderia heleia]
MFNLSVRPEAAKDLEAIKAKSRDDHAMLLFLLREVRDDRATLEHLADDGVWESPSYDIDVTPFAYMQKRHFDMWRIKAYEFGKKVPVPYRLIYAVDNVRQDYHLFAIMKREDGKDYENDPALVERIRRIYLDLGLPFKG